jgi:methylenetetrahydrofolate reductase (NADPH)
MTLKTKIDKGEFAILAEMEPPKGVDVSAMTKTAGMLKGRVDALVVPEMSNAVMRMSALGGAMILQSKGLETVMQVNCRDRNRIALQADLLAAAGCGITNVMAVTGEDPSYGDHHQARSVYDIDLLQLLEAIGSLGRGKDMAGIDLAGAPEFLVGSTSDAGAKGKSLELELEEVKKKADAGARFFITPPVFNTASIEPFITKASALQVSIIPTVILLKSLGMARYMAKNMGHIAMPDELISRLQKAPDKVRECILIAAETVRAFKAKGFSGVMIATIGWEHKLPEILERV